MEFFNKISMLQNSRKIFTFSERFVLSENTKNYIRSLTPNFGFNGLGEFVFQRTYSRNGENWADVVIRVIEGVISIRKNHYLINNLRWVDQEWQEFALEMSLSMFNMEWLPPGRGLWMMGTDFVLERGSMALNNCGAVDTTDDIVHAAEWTMDALMNGVGVGFNTNWRGFATIPDKSNNHTVVIEDSREGWVDSLIYLMTSYIDSPMYGKRLFPIFDYSKVRKSGLPIKGFGGVSSGPEPLQKLHTRIESYLDAFCLGRLQAKSKTWKEVKTESGSSEWVETEIDVDKPYNHTRFISDVFNAIGACVVAGNVRRSAQIAIGGVSDETFLNLKNYEMNPERSDIGWMSNNSVVLGGEQDFNDFSFIPKIASRIRDNGEPGIINLYNIQKYGRYGKPMHDDASLVNPCFSGDTLVAVADGRNCVTIKQLAEEGKDIPVYSMNPIDGEVSIKWGRRPRITGVDKKLYRIHFKAPHKDQHLDVTENHEFFLNDGRNVRTKDLKKGDSIPQFKKEKYTDGYVRVNTKGNKTEVEHRLIAKFCYPDKFKELYNENEKMKGCCEVNGVVIHHKDENKSNNSPDNLEVTTFEEHMRHHGQELTGTNNPMHGKTHTESTKQKISAKAVERCNDPEYIQKLKDAQTDELRERSRQIMTKTKYKLDVEKTDKQEEIAIATGLNYTRLDTRIIIHRICENESCKREIDVDWGHREQPFCSTSCANTKKESIQSRRIGQKKTFESKAEINFQKQAAVYLDLVQEKGHPDLVYKKDWEAACKTNGISYRFNAKTDNPWIASGWKQFLEMVDEYNHQVDYIEELEGLHTVYDLTVDENHTVAIVTKYSPSQIRLIGLYTYQCSEIPLCSYELCNLSEIFPTRCKDEQNFYKALEFGTFYASTVSLLPTHRPETNAIISKNRRIGVSISGIAQWVDEHNENWGHMNYTRMTKILRKGYGIVRNINKKLAELAGVPASIRVTTIKPSGSISLLAGATAGMHYPISRYAIRRVRVADNSHLVDILKSSGVKCEKDTYSDNTLVFSFAIDHGNVRACENVSPWEQFTLNSTLQRCWSDNMVSCCLTKDHYVHTDLGFVRIDNLCSEKDKGFHPHNLNVINEKGTFEESTHYYVNGKSSTIKITLASGKSIRGTENHKIRVYSSDTDDYVWKKLKDININDWVATRIGVDKWPTQTNATINIINSLKKYSNGKYTFTPKLPYWLGCLMNIKVMILDDTIVLDEINEKEAQNICKLTESLFGIECFIENNIVTIKNQEIRDFVVWLGLPTKIPDIIMMGSKEIVISFIQGLTRYASIDTNGIKIISLSEEKLYQLDILLGNFGILGKIDKLSVFSVKIKKDNNVEVSNMFSYSLMYNSAYRFSKIIGLQSEKDSEVLVNHFSGFKNSDMNILLEDTKTVNVDVRLDSTLLFMRVIKTQYLSEEIETFDISVSDTHSYLANNIISHNTIYFDKKKDGNDVEKLLAMYIPTLKSVSMLPHSGHGYAQAPYEPITAEEYEILKNSYCLPSYQNISQSTPQGELFCTGDTCTR